MTELSPLIISQVQHKALMGIKTIDSIAIFKYDDQDGDSKWGLFIDIQDVKNPV
jgi:hypothetical protein